MSEEIFRKKNLDKIKSPENLNDYLRVSNPGVWMLLAAVIVLLIGAVIASAVVLIGRNRIAGLAVMWAYAGILIRHISAAYYAGSHPFVIAAGFLSEAVILAAILGPQMCKIARNKCCCTKGA